MDMVPHHLMKEILDRRQTLFKPVSIWSSKIHRCIYRVLEDGQLVTPDSLHLVRKNENMMDEDLPFFLGTTFEAFPPKNPSIS